MSVDIVVITALKDEFDAVKAVDDGAVGPWTSQRDSSGFSFAVRAYRSTRQGVLKIALARTVEMGGLAASQVAVRLVKELAPRCLAMCGICAGRRGKTSLGDVIVADRIYKYDGGKIIADPEQAPSVWRDLKTYQLDPRWRLAIDEMPEDWRLELARDRPRTYREQELWLLQSLFTRGENGPSPADHPERVEKCPDWTQVITRLRERQWLTSRGLALTAAGHDFIEDQFLLHPDGLPMDEPFRVHVGPIASGDKVVEDERVFQRLAKSVRKVIGLEMEAAAIGMVAELERIPWMLVAKGVSDFADHDKDDRFRYFAARASATFLLEFLRRELEPTQEATHQDASEHPSLDKEAGENDKSEANIMIRIDQDETTFDQRQIRLLQYALAGLLEISPDAVKVARAEKGSVKLFLDLAPTEARRLHEAYRNRDPRLIKLMEEFPLKDLRLLSGQTKSVPRARRGASSIITIGEPRWDRINEEPGYLFSNGVNGDTGQYLMPPMSKRMLAGLVQDRILPENHRELGLLTRQKGRVFLSPISGIDTKRLDQTGWGVIFARDADPKITKALKPLLKLRQDQAGSLYRILDGEQGYRAGESKNRFLARHGIGFGPVDPINLPYYLLLVGSPEEIPFEFQFQLDVQYAVGRLHFARPADYAAYARGVVDEELKRPPRPATARFFGPVNPDDQLTRLSADSLVAPLAKRLTKAYPHWDLRTIIGEDASKQRLSRMMGEDETPSLLFTAGHSVIFGKDSPRLFERQGSLVCRDWPGPQQWSKPLKASHYFAARDINKDASFSGLISFHFTCWGAGTPRYDDFYERAFKVREELTTRAFVARLPSRLLSHRGGSALAVISHADRAWHHSFKWPDSVGYATAFESAFRHLLAAQPVGAAVEYLNQRYAELATALTEELREIDAGREEDLDLMINLWTAHNDARSYIVLGDPAVRLNVSQPEQPTDAG